MAFNNSPHKSCDLHEIQCMLHDLKHLMYQQNSQQYAYDKLFSEYVQRELNKIKTEYTPDGQIADMQDKLDKLRNDIKTGIIIPVIPKPKIKKLFN